MNDAEMYFALVEGVVGERDFMFWLKQRLDGCISEGRRLQQESYNRDRQNREYKDNF